MENLAKPTQAKVLLNGSSYALSSGAELYVIAPAEKPAVNALCLGVFISPGASVHFQSLEFRVESVEGSTVWSVVEENISGLGQPQLASFMSTGRISNQNPAELQVALQLFPNISLPKEFTLHVPVRQMSRAQGPAQFRFQYSESHNGLMLVHG